MLYTRNSVHFPNVDAIYKIWLVYILKMVLNMNFHIVTPKFDKIFEFLR